jgi:hypothetical protein
MSFIKYVEISELGAEYQVMLLNLDLYEFKDIYKYIRNFHTRIQCYKYDSNIYAPLFISYSKLKKLEEKILTISKLTHERTKYTRIIIISKHHHFVRNEYFDFMNVSLTNREKMITNSRPPPSDSRTSGYLPSPDSRTSGYLPSPDSRTSGYLPSPDSRTSGYRSQPPDSRFPGYLSQPSDSRTSGYLPSPDSRIPGYRSQPPDSRTTRRRSPPSELPSIDTRKRRLSPSHDLPPSKRIPVTSVHEKYGSCNQGEKESDRKRNEKIISEAIDTPLSE